jgi:apolipoprotein D and lipocalin family protein
MRKTVPIALVSLAFALLAVLNPLTSEAGTYQQPLQTVSYVDLPSYLGQWFEVARIPNWFQKGCRNTTATYGLNEDSTISVFNRCEVVDETTGQRSVNQAQGKAWIENRQTNAELCVSFVKFIGWWKIFGGDYWILELGPKTVDGLYSYTVIGEPSREYGWILARTRHLPEGLVRGIFERLSQQGYDTSRFQMSTND